MKGLQVGIMSKCTRRETAVHRRGRTEPPLGERNKPVRTQHAETGPLHAAELDTA